MLLHNSIGFAAFNKIKIWEFFGLLVMATDRQVDTVNINNNVLNLSQLTLYLTIIPRARMGSE